MDVFDLASELEAKQRDAAIQKARATSAAARTKARGSCLNCDEPFPEGSASLYCDSDCAHDHQRRTKNAA